MRVHKKKHGAERLEACGNIVIKDLKAEGNTSQVLFGNDNPIRIEIGCGKGDFIVGTAAKEPDVNFLAVEKISDVLVIAAEKVKNSGLSNVRVCCVDAKELEEILLCPYWKSNIFLLIKRANFLMVFLMGSLFPMNI